MNENESADLLARHGIKPTANRIVVAKTLAKEDRPLSLSELERKIMTIDKSGIFRALTLFRDHHLVHAIEDGGEGVRYELCRSHSDTDDDDMHVHFFCECCHQTSCLDDIHIPPVSLPDGYEMTTANYVVKGICPNCADKQ